VEPGGGRVAEGYAEASGGPQVKRFRKLGTQNGTTLGLNKRKKERWGKRKMEKRGK